MYKVKNYNLFYNALEPYLGYETVKRHYQIYTNYVNRLNELLPNTNYSLEEVIKNIDKFPIKNRDQILYNASAILNHELYFNNLNVNKNKPIGKFKEKIDSQYGDFETFKNEFKKTASYLVGSGYTFLVLNNNELEIINTSNQDNPYLYGLIPIMALDLFEHSYYLDYFSRQEYINIFFSIVDLEEVSSIYEKYTQ